MSSYIDLTISPNYVPGWKTWEGVRELIQNAFDREREDVPSVDPATRVWSTHPSTIDYDEMDETLTISNNDTILDRRTLMLGEGTKSEGGSTIGQHGEGYKLALLALLRAGHAVEIDNGNQLWEPEFVESAKLHARVLRINFHKGTPGNKALTFRVRDMSTSQWETIQDNVRRLHESGEELRGEGGWVLTDDRERGRLYVGGIFVTNLDSSFLYGYDFDPSTLHLDRDRSTVDSFNLQWECGRVHAGTGEAGLDLAFQAVMEDTADARRFVSGASELLRDLSDKSYEHFRAKFGERAVPVSYQYEVSEVAARYPNVKPVIVGDAMKVSILESEGYRAWIVGQEKKPEETPEFVLRSFLADNKEYFSQVLADKFNAEIIERCEREGWVN